MTLVRLHICFALLELLVFFLVLGTYHAALLPIIESSHGYFLSKESADFRPAEALAVLLAAITIIHHVLAYRAGRRFPR
jgi:hypothetical protein